MRLDKFLKVSHLVKRREVAHDFINLGKVLVNGKIAKPSTIVKKGDIVVLNISELRKVSFEVVKILEHCSIEEGKTMYKILEDTKQIN